MKGQDTAPGTAPMDAKALKAAAFARVKARRKVREFKTWAGPYGDVKREINEQDPEIKVPETAAEWLDDQIVRLPMNAVGQVLAVIFTAAREGPDRGAAAVAAASRLSPWNQYYAWGTVDNLDAKLPDATRIMREIKTEWKSLGLAKKEPQTPLIVERNRPVFASAAGGTAYSPSVPMEMRAQWQR